MLFNRSRALEYMQQSGVDALVATSPVNVTYFTDYFSWSDPLFKDYMMSPGAASRLAQNCAVFPAEGDPALVIGPAFALNARDSWVEDLRFFGDFGLDDSLLTAPSADVDRRFLRLLREAPHYSTATEALLAILRARGLEDARIGLDAESLPPSAQDAIRSGLPGARIKNCSNLLRLVRAVKSLEETARLKRAAEISEHAVFEAMGRARPGVSSLELVREYRVGVAKLGADFDHFAIAPRGYSIFSEPDYRFMHNDVTYADFGCIHGHYFSDTATTLAVGGIPPALMKMFEAVRECMDAGARMMRPGVKGSQIQAAMAAALKERGVTVAFPHGHGMGMEMRDYPIIVPNNGLRIKDDCVDVASDLPMEEGMINNLEVGVFLPVAGSVAIEESFVVTAQGAHPLVPQNRSTPFVAA